MHTLLSSRNEYTSSSLKRSYRDNALVCVNQLLRATHLNFLLKVRSSDLTKVDIKRLRIDHDVRILQYALLWRYHEAYNE